MQLFPIFLVAVILAADGGLRLWPVEPAPSLVEAGATVLAAMLGILAVSWIVIRWCYRQLNRDGRSAAIRIAERTARYARWAILLVYVAAIFTLGWLDAVRATVGNLILVDEVIVLSPAVLSVLGSWWTFYPIERRIREAMLIRRLDLGHVIHPMPSRGRYVWEQARMGLLLMLVPLLMILGLAEAIRATAAHFDASETATQIIELATLIAALCVFLIAPLLARALLSVQPLPDGPLRHSLMSICERHGVAVREILLWRTSGSMINAAVMGLIGRLRYVLITDALLEAMTTDQVKAVMAHEVGHVRKHHMPWMVMALIAVLILTAGLIELPMMAARTMGMVRIDGPSEWVIGLLLGGQLAAVLLLFGWVSRRFERQADTFAVEHLSESGLGDDDCPAVEGENANDQPDAQNPDRTILPSAVATMCSALQSVAELNAVDPKRPSWRHGAIIWRQSYLHSIIGLPIGGAPIDRIVQRIKLATSLVVLSGIAVWAMMTAMYH